MIGNLLAAAEPVRRTMCEPSAILVLLVSVFFICLIIIGLIRLVRFLGTANKEMKLTRMEVGKLAEEVHILRQELKERKKGNS